MSSIDTPPPSPTKPRRRPPLRLDPIGISPKTLIGKVLTRVRNSPNHPTITLDCSDGSSFQIRIDGYNPSHPGVPKSLEMDSFLHPIFFPSGSPATQAHPNLTIIDCALITLLDKAHDVRNELQGPRDEQWDQHHIGVAFKFLEEVRCDPHGRGWHCVWATLAEYEADHACVFRSYDDVYLESLPPASPLRSPKKRSPKKRTSSRKD